MSLKLNWVRDSDGGFSQLCDKNNTPLCSVDSHVYEGKWYFSSKVFGGGTLNDCDSLEAAEWKAMIVVTDACNHIIDTYMTVRDSLPDIKEAAEKAGVI